MLSFFCPSRLSCWTFLTFESTKWISKHMVLAMQERICLSAKNKALFVFWLSCKILFFTNQNHCFGSADQTFNTTPCVIEGTPTLQLSKKPSLLDGVFSTKRVHCSHCPEEVVNTTKLIDNIDIQIESCHEFYHSLFKSCKKS